MEDLIKLITQKFGVDAGKAKGIIETVVSHIQAKLPGPVGEQVAKLLGSGAGAAGTAGVADQAGGGVGGFLDKAKKLLGDKG